MQNLQPALSGIRSFKGDGRSYVYRLFPGNGDATLPLLVFCHGFKGFIDWGGFPLVMQGISMAGFPVLQFNFSLNGTLPAEPDYFGDLDAFRRNTLSREVMELLELCDELRQGEFHGVSFKGLVLGGHSRGAYIVGAAASHVSGLRGLLTWAGVVKMRERLLRYDHDAWQRQGVIAELNTRTGQMMELGYSLWQDFERDEHGFFRESAFMPAEVPLLMVHGSADQAVEVEESRDLLRRRDPLHTFLFEVPGSDHTFGMKHPLSGGVLPEDTLLAMQVSTDFLRRC